MINSVDSCPPFSQRSTFQIPVWVLQETHSQKEPGQCVCFRVLDVYSDHGSDQLLARLENTFGWGDLAFLHGCCNYSGNYVVWVDLREEIVLYCVIFTLLGALFLVERINHDDVLHIGNLV